MSEFNVMTPMIYPDDLPDEEKWYKLQSNYNWYAIRACCRSCATRRLLAWTDELGYVKTKMTPDWLVELECKS